MKCAYSLLLAVLLAGTCSTVRGQQAEETARPTVFAVVNFMKSAEGKRDEYIKIERDVWKKVHLARVKDGVSLGWRFIELANGTNDARDYDFITVDMYGSLRDLEESDFDTYLSEALSSQEQNQIQNTQSLRDLVRTELWTAIASTTDLRPAVGGVSLVHYMKPTSGKVSEYASVEATIFQKLHQARVDAGVMRGWVFAGRIFPSGSGCEYEFITINMFESLEQARTGWDEKVVAPTFDKLAKEQQSAAMSIDGLRRIVKQDVWKLLDFVPQPQD